MTDASKARNGLDRKPISQERLKQLLHYDLETGVFTWLENRPGGNRSIKLIRKEDVAGCVKKHKRRRTEYIQIGVDGGLYLAHTLAIFYCKAYWPSIVDHKDNNGTNNKISNLRDCTNSENLANTPSWSHNTSGHKGVSWSKSRCKWRADISYRGKKSMIGRFDTREEAIKAYADKAKEVFGEFASLS